MQTLPDSCDTRLSNLLSAASGGAVHLIIDSTKIAFGFRLVMVSVAYRRRSLPIA